MAEGTVLETRRTLGQLLADKEDEVARVAGGLGVTGEVDMAWVEVEMA